jgi:hypothetical protein
VPKLKSKILRIELIALGIFLTLFALYLAMGCAEVRRAADDAQYVLGGSGGATSQPSSLRAARAGVQIIKEFVPVGDDILALAAGAAALIGLVAGHFDGKRLARKEILPHVAEIAGDIASHHDEYVPFTDDAAKLLSDAGYGHVAKVRPDPAAPSDPAEEMFGSRNYVAVSSIDQPHRIFIRINGKHTYVADAPISFEQIGRLAGVEHPQATMTYFVPGGGPSGILAPGEQINVVNGMIFSVAVTGNA